MSLISLSSFRYWLRSILELIIFCRIEHSENTIITLFGLFENEIGPGVHQLIVQKVRTLQENQRHKESANKNVSTLPLLSGILTEDMFVERWTRSFQVQSRFRNTQSFYFRDALFG